jgi:hypothetical protein
VQNKDDIKINSRYPNVAEVYHLKENIEIKKLPALIVRLQKCLAAKNISSLLIIICMCYICVTS